MTDRFTDIKRIAAARTKGRLVAYERGAGSYYREYEIHTPDGGVMFRSTSYRGMKEDAEFIAMVANNIDQLLAVVEAAQHRLSVGHNDTCQYALVSEYTCSCGHDELRLALEPFREECD